MSAGVCFKLVVVDCDGNKTGDVHPVHLSPPVKFADLERNAKELLNAPNVKFWYIDEEEDHCVISSQRILDDAIQLNASKPSIRVLVKAMGSAREQLNEAANREQILEGIRALLSEMKDITSDRIGDFRNLLNEVHTRMCAREQEPVYPLHHDKFRLFLDAMINDTVIDMDFVQVASHDVFMVPRDVIDFMNNKMKEKKQMKTEMETRRSEEYVQRIVKVLKENSFTAPDYAHPKIVKNYDGGQMTAEFEAEQNGYLVGTIRTSGWCYAKINGKSVNAGGGFAACSMPGGAMSHFPFFIPIRKGDRFILENGDYHSVMFYPCIEY